MAFAGWENSRVLVSGGCGFIGSHLVRRLLALGATVRVADDLSTGSLRRVDLAQTGIEFHAVDVSDPVASEALFHDVDVVFDLAADVRGSSDANPDHWRTYRRTLLPALAVLKEVRQQGIRNYVYFSSSCVYRRDASTPLSEEEPLEGPLSERHAGYGLAKRHIEHALTLCQRDSSFSATILRPFNVSGPGATFGGDREQVVPALIRKVFFSEHVLEVRGTGKERRAFIDVRDLVRIASEVVERGTTVPVLNVSSWNSISVQSVAQLVLMNMKKPLPLSFHPITDNDTPVRIADTGLLRSVLGPQHFISLEESIRDTITQFRLSL